MTDINSIYICVCVCVCVAEHATAGGRWAARVAAVFPRVARAPAPAPRTMYVPLARTRRTLRRVRHEQMIHIHFTHYTHVLTEQQR